MRKLHSLLGLWVAVLAVVLALSGAILSLDPALERQSNTLAANGQTSVAVLAGRVAQHYPGVEQIQRTPSGSVIVYYRRDGQTGVDHVDPQTGQGIAPHTGSPLPRWMKKLHRSWLLDTPGRVVSGLTALAMLVLSVTGTVLLVRRVGGWRHLADPLRGNLVQRCWGCCCRPSRACTCRRPRLRWCLTACRTIRIFRLPCRAVRQHR